MTFLLTVTLLFKVIIIHCIFHSKLYYVDCTFNLEVPVIDIIMCIVYEDKCRLMTKKVSNI